MEDVSTMPLQFNQARLFDAIRPAVIGIKGRSHLGVMMKRKDKTRREMRASFSCLNTNFLSDKAIFRAFFFFPSGRQLVVLAVFLI